MKQLKSNRLRHLVYGKVFPSSLQEAKLQAELKVHTPLEACKEILSRLAPDDANGAQCKLYSDALHPTDDDKTVVDYLREVIEKATT